MITHRNHSESTPFPLIDLAPTRTRFLFERAMRLCLRKEAAEGGNYAVDPLQVINCKSNNET